MTDAQLLVASADDLISRLIEDIATEAGLVATVARSNAMFKLIYDPSYQIIMLDLFMPDGDGIELLRYLAEQGCQGSLILVSEAARRGVLRSAQELAAARGLHVIGCLSKPFSEAELRNLLRLGDPRDPVSRPKSAIAPVTLDDFMTALNNGEITAYFQPKIDPRSGKLVSVEALARWQHSQYGMISPGVFIPMAEQANLMDRLFDVVAQQAIQQVARWNAAGLRIKVALNLSIFGLVNLALPERIAELARIHGVDTSQIVVELTESGSISDTAALDILTRLHLKGIELAIDDFGTGYSTLQQLQRIPFSELKLDQSFVRNAMQNADAREILVSMLEMAHRLKMRVVAEGVETQDQMQFLAHLGCHEVQGFLIAKALKGDDLLDWWRSWDANREQWLAQLGIAVVNTNDSGSRIVLDPNTITRPAAKPLKGWYLEGIFADSPMRRRQPVAPLPFRIGRQSDVELCLPYAMISRVHAEIVQKGKQLILRDLNSTNGTFVNHQRIKGELALKSGDIVRFADFEYRLGYEVVAISDGETATVAVFKKQADTPSEGPATAFPQLSKPSSGADLEPMKAIFRAALHEAIGTLTKAMLAKVAESDSVEVLRQSAIEYCKLIELRAGKEKADRFWSCVQPLFALPTDSP